VDFAKGMSFKAKVGCLPIVHYRVSHLQFANATHSAAAISSRYGLYFVSYIMHAENHAI